MDGCVDACGLLAACCNFDLTVLALTSHVYGQREEQLKEDESDSIGHTVCYTCALGDFGHSYILSQHEESRSGVAHQGAGFVAPGRAVSQLVLNHLFCVANIR